jgi:hypothetical protein
LAGRHALFERHALAGSVQGAGFHRAGASLGMDGIRSMGVGARFFRWCLLLADFCGEPGGKEKKKRKVTLIYLEFLSGFVTQGLFEGDFRNGPRELSFARLVGPHKFHP